MHFGQSGQKGAKCWAFQTAGAESTRLWDDSVLDWLSLPDAKFFEIGGKKNHDAHQTQQSLVLPDQDERQDVAPLDRTGRPPGCGKTGAGIPGPGPIAQRFILTVSKSASGHGE
jgi:hypothetical protein